MNFFYFKPIASLSLELQPSFPFSVIYGVDYSDFVEVDNQSIPGLPGYALGCLALHCESLWEFVVVDW